MKTKLRFQKWAASPTSFRDYQGSAEVIVETGCPLFNDDYKGVPEVARLFADGYTLTAHIDGVEDPA
jgi:hypothetical protein